MKKILIIVSITMNVLVVLLFIIGYLSLETLGRHFIQEPNTERLTTQFAALSSSPDDVVFLGDSITELSRWHELFPGAPVRNRGISGDTTDGVLRRLDQITAGKPAKVFLLIGTNDLLWDTPEEEIAGNIERIVDRIATESPTTEIYVQSVLPRGIDYRENVETLNAMVRARLGSDATWIDLYPLFLADDGSIRDDLANDELHLLGPGYVIWRDHIDHQVRN